MRCASAVLVRLAQPRSLSALSRTPNPMWKFSESSRSWAAARTGAHDGSRDVGQSETVEQGCEQDAAVAEGAAALHLAHRRLDVPERQHHQRDEPARVGAGELGEEVVVRLDALRRPSPGRAR